MKALRLTAALVVALTLQTTLAHTVMGNRTIIDLVLILVIFVALGRGAVAGLLFGSLAGLCQDALSGGILGVGGLAKSVVGAAVGALATQFIITNPLPRFVAFFGGSVVHAACFLGILALITPGRVGYPWAGVLTQATVNAVTGLVVFAAVERFPEAVRRRRLRRTHLRRRVEA